MKNGQGRDIGKEDALPARFVKLELDAAQALADFSRIAHLRVREKRERDTDAGLQWFGKRKRSRRYKEELDPIGMERTASSIGDKTAKNGSIPSRPIYPAFGEDQGHVRTAERDKLEDTTVPESSKDSLRSDSRADSPNSPLPSLQLECSSFQRAVPAPVKTQIEELHVDVSAIAPQKLPVKRNPWISKPPSLAGLAKLNDAKTSALSEIGKNACRLRRVLANRKSARQTIQRKQIQCQELRKQATSLTLENRGMKERKESLMQKLCSLKNQNQHLTEQLALQLSSNLKKDFSQQGSETPSQNFSLLPLKAPVLPFTGGPLQSLVWTLAAAKAPNMNLVQTGDMMSGSETNMRVQMKDVPRPAVTRQHQSASFLFPHTSGTPVTNRVSTCGVSVPKHTHNSNGFCSPLVAASSHKEMSFVSGSCGEDYTLQMTGVHTGQEFDSNNMKMHAADAQLSAADLTEHPSSQSQPLAALCAPFLESQGIKSEVDPCGSSMASGNTESSVGNVTTELTQALQFYRIPSCKIKMALGSLQACSFTGRKTSAAAIAAAEARRRRKELTRNKFFQSRAFRLRC